VAVKTWRFVRKAWRFLAANLAVRGGQNLAVRAEVLAANLAVRCGQNLAVRAEILAVPGGKPGGSWR
jgi:hypothetical protein